MPNRRFVSFAQDLGESMGKAIEAGSLAQATLSLRIVPDADISYTIRRN